MTTISPALLREDSNVPTTEVYTTKINREILVDPGIRGLCYESTISDTVDPALRLKYYNGYNQMLYYPNSISNDNKVDRKFIIIKGDSSDQLESYVKVNTSEELFDDTDQTNNDFQKRFTEIFTESISNKLSTLGNFYDLMNLYDIGGINHIVNSIMTGGGYQQYIKYYDIVTDSYELFSKLESIPPITGPSTHPEPHPVIKLDNIPILLALTLVLGMITHKAIYYETITDEEDTLIGFGGPRIGFNCDALIDKTSYLNAELIPDRFLGDYVNFRGIYDNVYFRESKNLLYNNNSTNNIYNLKYYSNLSTDLILIYKTSKYTIKYPEIDPVNKFFRLVVCQVDLDILYYEAGKYPERKYLYFEFMVKDEPYIVYAQNDDYDIRSASGGYGSYVSQELIDKGFNINITYKRPFISVSKDRVIYYSGSNPIFPFVIKSCDINRIDDTSISISNSMEIVGELANNLNTLINNNPSNKVS